MSLGRKSKGSEGFIPISRKLFNNFLWEEKREFSRAEAWIDLLQLARFEANSTKEIINGRVIESINGASVLCLCDFLLIGGNGAKTGLTNSSIYSFPSV